MPKQWEHLLDPKGSPTTDPNIGIPTLKSLETVFSNILNIAVALAGIVLFVMLIIGGLGYLTSAGEPEKVKKSGATLTWAIVGFVLLIVSWFILNLLGQFTGIDLIKFEIPGI